MLDALQTANNLIEIDGLIEIKDGLLFVNGREVDKDVVVSLKEQSSAFLKTLLWDFAKREIKKNADLTLYQAKSDVELIGGQMMIYNLQILQKFFEDLLEL